MNQYKRKKPLKESDAKAYRIITSGIMAILFILIGNIFFPDFFNIIWSVLWFLLLSIVIIFIGIGALVVFGLRNEAHSVLDLLLEGSLTLLDFTTFIRKVIAKFTEKLKEFLMFIAPGIAYIQGFIAYLLLLLLYKYVGIENDVTLLTAILTVSLIAIVGTMTAPKTKVVEAVTWNQKFNKKIKDNFSDALEVVIFIFFLTMDSTNLFFLPDQLNIPLHAEIGNYDLMIRGFSTDSGRITLTIIIIAIFTEIVRNTLRIVLTAIRYYKEALAQIDVIEPRMETLKDSIRKSFNQGRDEIIKFITFTTVLVAVFMLFPRLKIFSMAIASITTLFLDLAIPRRMTAERGNDLISRLLTKAFKV